MASHNDTARDEAALWVARMDAGVWDEHDESELQAWLDVDARRSGLLLQAQAAWLALNPAQNLAREAETPPPRVYRRRSFFALAGTALAASVAGGLFWFDDSTRFTTQVGEIRRVPLADGSIAAINTASQLNVTVAETRRSVTIDRGEAWFQVAKDAGRPFVVEAGSVRVRAVGTAFSVRRYDNGAEVLVTEGIVETWVSGAEQRAVLLKAGQRAFVNETLEIKEESAPPSSIDRALAWRGGNIDLAGERLSEAVADLNRYNRKQIVLADPALGDERFDGVFRTDDPEGFAMAVHSSLNVRVTIADDAITIGSAKK